MPKVVIKETKQIPIDHIDAGENVRVEDLGKGHRPTRGRYQGTRSTTGHPSL